MAILLLFFFLSHFGHRLGDWIHSNKGGQSIDGETSDSSHALEPIVNSIDLVPWQISRLRVDGYLRMRTRVNFWVIFDRDRLARRKRIKDHRYLNERSRRKKKIK